MASLIIVLKNNVLILATPIQFENQEIEQKNFGNLHQWLNHLFCDRLNGKSQLKEVLKMKFAIQTSKPFFVEWVHTQLVVK